MNSSSYGGRIVDYFSSKTMKGLEIGLGNPGADFNFGYGVEAQGRTITGTVVEIKKEVNRVIKD